MPNPVQDRLNAGQIRGPGRTRGNDRWDEVWDGVYVLMPNPDIEHQRIADNLTAIIGTLVDRTGPARPGPARGSSTRAST